MKMKTGVLVSVVAASIRVMAAIGLGVSSPSFGLASAIPILTYHYNKTRTGANQSETILTPANVNVSNFGKLFSLTVRGGIYTQPLYVPNLTIPGQGAHNVVYVATQHNWVYAFDADNGATLWSVKLGPYQPNPQGCAYPGDTGVIGTPVIKWGTIYAVASTLRNGVAQQELHALNITTGAEQPSSPVVITATVPGTGFGSAGGKITFNPVTEFQRAALLFDDGVLYIGFAAHCDFQAFSAEGHGWLFSYNPSSLQQESSFIVTPNGFGGAIWAAGGGPAADSNHNIYFSTGDGTFDANSGGKDYGDSIVKLAPGTLSLLDYFTPSNQAQLEADEADLGSGGVLLLPIQSTTPTNLLVTSGKTGFIYLVNRDNLGHFAANVVQVNPNIVGLFGTATFWNNYLYFVGSGYGGGDSPKAFSFSGGLMSNNPTSTASETYPFPGAIPVVSANGENDGILWALEQGGTPSGNEVLHAYKAKNLAKELYNSDQAGSRDLPGPPGKEFESIIVDNGKVYVPTSGNPQLSVFGLLPGH
jgi:hypothetical protein